MAANGPLITTRLDAASTADDVVAGVDLSGVRAVVTGASSGLGVETARSLGRAGAEVTLAVRNTAAGLEAARDITRSTGRHGVHVVAAVIRAALARTAEGWELQFATNYLGHFALSLGLRQALTAGARERGEARIVSVSSTAHMRSPVVFDDIGFERRDYDPQAAYAQSKTATSLFAVEATRRWAADGIVANAVNPGGVATGLQRHLTQKQKDYLTEAEAAGVFAYKTAGQGAAATLVAAVAPEFTRTGGHYLDDGREAY
jgi:NAD(P)-dependent dehydrogenase (short-subunit alcohol dehydrogenase family)